MITNLQSYFGPETIYLWLNFGVLPLWFALIFFPNSRVSLTFISSIFLPIIFSIIYLYIISQLIINGGDIFENFDLYLGIENLHSLFSNDHFLLIFWSHYIGINLFLGSWLSRDALKYNIPKMAKYMEKAENADAAASESSGDSSSVVEEEEENNFGVDEEAQAAIIEDFVVLIKVR